MTDAPKRRGRPRKVRPEMAGALPPLTFDFWEKLAEIRAAYAAAEPTPRIRMKSGVGLQQAWRYATGTQWRTLPVVPADAPDWEDG
jgi:hypothetical protein